MTDSLIGSDTYFAISYRLAIYVLEWTFYKTPEKEKFFFNNPMNTIGAGLLRKGLEKSAIDIYSEVSRLTGRAKWKWSNISGMAALRNHRTYQAHRATGEFTDAEVRAFVESDQHFKDDIARRVWQVRASLIQIMYKNRQPVTFPLEIRIGPELADIVLNVLRYSCRDLGTLKTEHVEGTLKLFAPVIEASYNRTFQEDFAHRYSEPLLTAPAR